MEWSTILSSFFGAALGSFFTLTNERIRAGIARDTWLAQERWKLRADTYATILKLLNREIEAMERVGHILFQAAPPPEVDPEDWVTPKQYDEQIGTLIAGEIAPAAKALRETTRLAALWLSAPAVDALRGAASTVSGPHYFVDQFREKQASLDRAVDAIVAEAKRDLRLHTRGV